VTTAAPRPGTGRDDWLDEGLRLVTSLGAPADAATTALERDRLMADRYWMAGELAHARASPMKAEVSFSR
jgi:hypothetical protein